MDHPTTGPVLSFHGLSYRVKPSLWRLSRHSCSKKVLKGASGVARPGEITAIMGSSGSGKSTLIETLANRKDPRRVTGIVLVDGRPRDASFLLTTGYCEQDDYLSVVDDLLVLLGEIYGRPGMLTVRENLLFSAELRLPSDMTLEQKNARVEEVIEELQLSKCADSLIGSAIVRGISGGERKRVSLGREIVNDPRLIFLDEPTTGLDSKMASVVVGILARWAARGKTVVLSIHQPKYSIFKSFHSLLLMADGEVAYHGRGDGVVPYFAGLGYVPEAFNNPADWVLDILNEDGPTGSVSSGTDRSEGGEEESGSVPLTKHFPHLFQASTQHADLQLELHKIEEQARAVHCVQGWKAVLPSLKRTTREHAQHEPQFATGLWHQTCVVSRRCVLSSVRNPIQMLLQFAAMIFFGLLVGGLYYDLDLGPSGIQNRIGAFFLLVMIFTFSNISVLELFIEERALYFNEKSGGFYRPLAYFLARTTCDIVPLRVIPGSIFCVLTYHLLGLRSGWQHLLAYTAILLMTSLSAASVCLLASTLVPVFAVANLGVALTYILFMMSSGLLINLDHMPSWLLPLRYVSIYRYSLEALAVNEFDGLTFSCGVPSPNGAPCSVPGSFFLKSQQYTHGVWTNVAVLAGMFVFYMLATFVLLRRMRKNG